MANMEIISPSLDRVLINIAMSKKLNGEANDEISWETFVANNPDLVRYEYGTAYRIALGAREVLERQNIHKQKLGGAIMRAHFTNEEIEKYGREEV